MKKIGQLSRFKLTAAAFTLIGASALLFNFCSESAAAAELSKQQAVPTTYNVTPAAVQNPESDYKPANFKIVQDPLVTDTPTAKDLTMEEAADLGAQMLWDVLGADLEGVTIYMGYCPGTETFARAFWSGDAVVSAKREPDAERYGFIIDAVTGERFSCGYSRTLEETVPLGYDSALAENCDDYIELAGPLAEKINLVHGPVESVVYGSQGYGGNDPLINFRVKGENGEEALIEFSRYDKKFLGVIYDTSMKISDQSVERAVGEVAEMQAMPLQ